MDKFFKKRPFARSDSQNPSKRTRPNSPSPASVPKFGSPRTIVAWNCNGLTSRIRGGDGQAIKDFISLHKPDVIFLSEVRVAAANNCSNGKPGPNTKWYRSKMRNSDKKSAEDCGLVHKLLHSEELTTYSSYLSLADTKYAGTAMLLNTETTQPPVSMRYNLDGKDVKKNVHDPEGRVIVAKFKDFTILHTYSPNNGWEEEHFARRQKWDERVRKFMVRSQEETTKMMWIGDLNVAPLDVDLSHASYYRKQTGGRYAKGKSVAIAEEDVGQPGCTDNERKRFSEILEAGSMVDAYRNLVGEKDASGFSWRGHPTGKHGGRGMRIDHCIVSRTLMQSVTSVNITGHGSDRKGFLGSDHCPLVILTCSDPDMPSEDSKACQK